MKYAQLVPQAYINALETMTLSEKEQKIQVREKKPAW